MASELTVHEWGTFTSFMGSNGELIEGMHHEDEALPSFVHGLKNEASTNPTNPNPGGPRPCRPRPGTKVDCFTLNNLIQTHSVIFPEAPISSGITQKMETPVIYFYGNDGQKVNVEINFPQGIITQYYPEASFSFPKFKEARELKDSRFIFDVTLGSLKDPGIPGTPAQSIWNPARQVPNANFIKAHNGEKEKFIFYRGVGNFNSPLKVSSNENNILSLRNLSRSPISMAIILNSDGVKGAIKIVKNILSQVNVTLPIIETGMSFNQYVSKTKSTLVSALVENGLFQDEAVAMVNTWEKSYFNTPGIRVLYIVPNEDAESILPLTVSPRPSELKRVLVGRIEVMTKNEENQFLELLKNSKTINREAVFGRFYESKLRRLEQIAPFELKSLIKNLYK